MNMVSQMLEVLGRLLKKNDEPLSDKSWSRSQVMQKSNILISSQQLHHNAKESLLKKTINQDLSRGIFQGDSLSPFPFHIVLTRLAHELNRSKCGYQVYGMNGR
jgi:hypothetical protein